MREHWIVGFLRWLASPQVSRLAMMAVVGLVVLLVLAKVGWVLALVGWVLGSSAG